MIVDWLWFGFLIGWVLLFLFYARCHWKAMVAKEGYFRLAQAIDEGKMRVQEDPATRIDFEKRSINFRCYLCGVFRIYEDHLEVPPGGLCYKCNPKETGRVYLKVDQEATEAYRKRVTPDINGNPPALKDVDEELAKQRADLEEERKTLVSRKEAIILLESLTNEREADLNRREQKIKGLEIPRSVIPAWAKDALWGMGLSGIALAFAWVATLIF